VRSSSVPTIAAVLAAGWLVTEAVGATFAAALLAAAIPSVVAAVALRRRPLPRRGGLTAFLVVMALVVAAAEAAIFLLPSGSPTIPLIQLVLFVLLAPAVPLVYARTFPPDDRSQR
jgi:hypothetical protein